MSAEESHRVGPTLIFKGQGRVSPLEKRQYAEGVNVMFTPKAVINKPSMDQFIEFWHGQVCRTSVSHFISISPQVRDGQPKLLIADSCNSHLNPDSIRRLREKSVVVAIIPGGTTMYLQVLDVNVFSVFKHHYFDAADEWLEENGPRNKVKLSSSQSRILCTRLTKSAWLRTLVNVDLRSAFRDIGYTWTDNTPVYPRALTGFCFDPSSISESSFTEINDDDNCRIEREATIAREEMNKQMSNMDRMKQSSLKQFWT